MPNKYIIHGATYNGNGTSSAEATADGGVGAWNSLNVFDAIGAPNYGGGSLVAGDTVFIRSKDASGNDLTRTLSATATLGSAAATSSAWVTWVLPPQIRVSRSPIACAQGYSPTHLSTG